MHKSWTASRYKLQETCRDLETTGSLEASKEKNKNGSVTREEQCEEVKRSELLILLCFVVNTPVKSSCRADLNRCALVS